MEMEALADLWHLGAQIQRHRIFGVNDSLRPVYATDGPISAQIDVPAMGTVGRRYRPGSLAFVSVNPAGGKSDSTSTGIDQRLYEALQNLRDAYDPSLRPRAFQRVNECFASSIVTWSIWRQYIDPILSSVGKSFDDVSYLYLVPFRSRGDSGSRMPLPFTLRGYEDHLRPQLTELRPGLIIAVDRPSEHLACRWRAESGTAVDVFYYTRKRDAHAERRRLLAELRNRYGC